MRSRKNLPALTVAAAPYPPPPPQAAAAPAIPEDYANPGLSLLQIFSILRAYWKHTAIIALVFVTVTAVFVKTLPKTYTATSTLMINNDRIEQNAAGQINANANGISMATEMQLIQSPDVLLAAIDRLKLTQDKRYTAGYRGDGNTLPDYVRENLLKDLDVVPGAGGSQLVNVTAAASSPNLASDIANAVTDIYLEGQRSRVSGPASERARRYAEELAELKDKVRVAQEQVTSFRQRSGATDAAARNNNAEAEILAGLEGRLQEARAQRRLAEVRAAADQNLTAGAASSPAILNLQTLVNTETADLSTLKATYGDNHPKVVALQEQINTNQKLIQQELHRFNASAASDLAAARDLENKLQGAVEAQQAKALQMSRTQDEGTKYVLELESAQAVYRRALDGYDQIMFANGNHLANISVVSRAVPPQKASKPNKVKMLMMGVIAGLMLGLGIPALYELLVNRRIRCRDDFERSFSVPVLIEFGRIALPKGAT